MAGAATFPSSRGRASPSVLSVGAVLVAHPRRGDGLGGLVARPRRGDILVALLEEVTFSLLTPEEVNIVK